MTVSGVRQFSHLLLEENEEYIGDFSCICTSNIKKRVNGRSFKGRIRIGSKSIIIEPDDSNMSLLKVLFAQISRIRVEKVNRMMIINCRSLRLISVQIIEGKSRTVTPSEILSSGEGVELRMSKRDPDDIKEAEPEFELCIKVSEDKGLELMDLCLELYGSQKKGGNLSKNENCMEDMSLMISNWLGRLYDNEVLNVEYEFLLDHRDRFLLEKPLIVNRIKPFSKLRGVLHILSSGICFKFLPNFSNKRFKRIPLDNIWFIFKRVYSTKPNSVEIIYEKEGKRNISGKISAKKNTWRSIFIEFQTDGDREHFVSFLQSFLIKNKESIINDGSISYASCDCCFDNKAPSCLPMLFIDPLYAGQSLCFRKHMQNLWVNGTISTYHYIDYLNGIGGRSRGDLTQYPVFPWTVINFDDDSKLGNNIDEFELESNYRDLSKPLGSINESNLEILKQRMRDLPLQEQFLYGSHYSNPGYISYFLIRKYPEYQLKLHCGDFDVWNRMFHSINDTWKTVLEGKTTYMELIPQFYEQNPDFLLNDRLSIRTNQGKLLNVQIPNWVISASSIYLKGTGSSLDNIKTIGASEHQKAEAFLRLMRYSLEGRVVSKTINEWIDLIFGYKQRGKEAAKHNNLFHPITYINSSIYLQKKSPINSIFNCGVENDLAIKSQVEEFGQVPIQLFSDPHPKRNCEYIDNNYILSQLDDIYSNSPWFVLLKNNPMLIRSEFDFNSEYNNASVDHSLYREDKGENNETYKSTGKCQTNNTRNYEKGINRPVYEKIDLSSPKNWNKHSMLNYEFKTGDNDGESEKEYEEEWGEKGGMDEDLNFNKLIVDFEKSYILNIKSEQTITRGIHLYGSVESGKDNLFQLISNSLTLGDENEFRDSLLVDAHENLDFTLLCTLFVRNGYLNFYVKRNCAKKQPFMRIYSGYVNGKKNNFNEGEITSMNVLLCEISKFKHNNIKSSCVYLTLGTLSGDVYYLKYKLLIKTDNKDEDTYLVVLKDERVIQNNMDSGIKFIYSIDYGMTSAVSVISSNGSLLLCKNCNEEDDFKKTTWFPLIDIPMKNKKVNGVLHFGLKQETNNDDLNSIRVDDMLNINKLATVEDVKEHNFSNLLGGNKDEKKKSRYAKITKDVDTEGFILSFILENNNYNRVFWCLNENGVFSVDLFGDMLLNLLITKYEYGNSVIKQIQNSKSISWIKLKCKNRKKEGDLIVYFGKVVSQFAGLGDDDELKIGTTIIIVWSCNGNCNVKVQRVLIVSGFEVDDNSNSCVSWDNHKKGIVLVGTITENSGVNNKDGKRGMYFISQNVWNLSGRNRNNSDIILLDAENNPNFNSLISFNDYKNKLSIKCTRNNIILHGNNCKSLFVLTVN
ncbi:hypothetical protein FG379_000610 [Cryptosporidium bovis]|uniref:uncharacterized protein n=1 Tax=Cryptosporidium bovis TaxID=310047 RepID=UPI00351A06ED|nr:hypothetical protein FG379_000610 [Cryptosporidium bovis]